MADGDDRATKLSVSTNMTSSAANALGPLVMGGGQGQRRSSGSRTGASAGQPGKSSRSSGTAQSSESVSQGRRSGGGAGADDTQTQLTGMTAMTSSAAAALGPLVGGGGARPARPSRPAQSDQRAGGRASDDSQTQLTAKTTMTSSAAAALGPLVSGGAGRGRASDDAGRRRGSDDAQTQLTAKTTMTSSAAAALGPLVSGTAGRGRTSSGPSASQSSVGPNAADQQRPSQTRRQSASADDAQTRLSVSSTATSSNAAMLLGPLVAASGGAPGVTSSGQQPMNRVQTEIDDARHEQQQLDFHTAEDNPLMEEDDRPEELRGLLGDSDGRRVDYKLSGEEGGYRCVGILTGLLVVAGLAAVFFTVVLPAIRRQSNLSSETKQVGQGSQANRITSRTTTAAATTAAPLTTAAPPSTPSPLTTASPPTTAAPLTTAPPTTAAPLTTAIPPTTAAPRTTPAAPQTTASLGTTAAPQTTAASRTKALRTTVAAVPLSTTTEELHCDRLAPGEWGSWTDCAACGGGLQLRSRSFPEGCPMPRERRACTAAAFVLVSDWTAWSDCDATCGAGLRARTRTANSETLDCSDMPVLREESFCRLKRCERSRQCPTDPDSLASEWTDWGPCSKTCNSGIQTRDRVRLAAFASCAGRPSLQGFRDCNTKSCAEINCRASPWSEWGRCEPSCGSGMKERFRRVDLGPNEVNPCPDLLLSQKTTCFGRSCSGHCAVGTWSLWTDCSTTCGVGQRERRRLPLGYPRGSDPPNCPVLVERGRCSAATPCSKPCTGKLVSHSVPHLAVESLQQCNGSLSYHSCSFSCAEGHTATGPLLCLNGDFRYAGARCIEAACNEVPAVAHSTDLTACAGAAPGATCTITCAPGYAKSDDATCERGSWSRVTCQALQCRTQLPRIPHAVEATIRCSTWALQAVSGQACPDFACEPGFQATGSLRCEDGNWVLPECLEESCLKPPVIKHALHLETCANRAAGALCEFQCTAGKLRTAAAVCNHGAWSDARCVDLDCARGKASACPDDARPCQSAPKISVDGKSIVVSSCAGIGSGGICEATAKCADGLRAAGRLVCSDGHWVGEKPHCKPLRCEGLPLVEHSADLGSCVGTPSGSICTVSCLAGYVREQDAVCRSGTWQGGKCAPLQCTIQPLVAHGFIDEVQCSRLALWGICPFHCHQGYVEEGELRCLGSITSGARCIPAPCRSPPNVAFVSDLKDCVGAPSGAVCTVQCRAGYVKTNDAICNLGEWTEAHCQPISCGEPPPIVHAEVDSLKRCAGLVSAERCLSLYCKDGFMKSTELLCTQGFFNAPKCAQTSCQSPPRTVEHSAQIHCSSRGAVKICKIECDGNRVKTGDVVCAAGAWRMPHCIEPKDAKRVEAATTRIIFSIQPGRLSDFLQLAAQVAAGVEAVAGVSPGRARVRSVSAQAHGRISVDLEIWSPAPTATESGHRRLEALPSTDGSGVTNDTSATRSARAAVSRLTGWAQLLGSHIDGAKADAPVAVEVLGYVAGAPCLQVPQILHAVSLERCAPALSGGICALQCESGFHPTADLVCSDGDWEQSTAECEAAACPEPPSVTHAFGLENCRGYPSGAVCPVLCKPGYRGMGEFLCNRGEWSGLGNCLPEPCAAAPTILRSAPLDACAGMPSGRRCQPLCKAGYSPTHPDGILCRNGNWNYQSAPSCMPTGCYAVPAVSHSRAGLHHCAGTPEHQRCDFECDVGFKAVGVLMCVEGVWSKPSCVPRKCMAVPHVQGGLDLQRCVGTASGRSCPVKCPAGQDKTGDLLCLRGVWQNEGVVRCNEPGQVSPACSTPPAIADADTPHCAGTLSGEFCDPCIPGYQLDGPLQCTAGAWSEAYCMPEDCQDIAGELTVHAERWTLCQGTAATGGCALQCKPGFSPAGRLIAKRPDELMRGVLHCSQGRRFKGPRCEAAPCESYPALAHSGDLEQCIGTADQGTCDATCLDGFELASVARETAGHVVSSVASCNRGRWQPGVAHCQEATCGLLPGHTQADPASRCKGTASQSFCEFDCTIGLSLAAPLLCRRGRWLAAAGATKGSTCRGFCVREPPVMGHVAGDLRSCTPMEGGEYCPISCEAGHLASGSLLCDPETLQWNLVTCGAPNELTRMEVRQSFQVTGLQARDATERRFLAESLLRGLSNLLRLSTHLMHLVLEPHTSSLPPTSAESTVLPLPFLGRLADAPESTQLRAKFRVACLQHQCEHVLKRLHLAGKTPKVFDEALSRSVCEDRCIPPGALETAAAAVSVGVTRQVPAAVTLQGRDNGPEATARAECLRECPEAKGHLQTIYRREPVIMATELR